MKKALLYLLLVMVVTALFSACATPVGNTAELSADPGTVSESAVPEAVESAPVVSSTPEATEEITEALSTPTASEPDADIADETKEYILHGQDDLPEAGKLQWTQAFLDQVDLGAVYTQYLADGGKAGDVKAFAEYLTENAPVPDNWKELFEANLLEEYGVTPSRYEALEDGYYHVYIMNDGNEVPYVAVNPRTGYFHG